MLGQGAAPSDEPVGDDPGPARYISLAEVGANVRTVKFG